MYYTELYDYLEQVPANHDFTISEIKKKFLQVENPLLRKAAEFECICFDFFFNDGIIEPIATWNYEDGSKKVYPDIETFTAEDVEYLKARLLQTNSCFLKARYAHLIWMKSHHNSFAKIAADNYLALSTIFLESKEGNDVCFHDYTQALHIFHNLSALSKHDTENCKNVLLSAMSSEVLPPLWKDNVAEIIVDSSLFKRKDCIGLTDKLISFLPTDYVEHFDPEQYLKTCLRLANKEGRPTKDIYNLLGENELTSVEQNKNDDSGMMAFSAYQGAAYYFRMAGNISRHQYASELFTKQKEKIRMDLIETTLNKEKTNEFFELQNLMLNQVFQSPDPLSFLANNKTMLLNEETLEHEAVRQVKRQGFMSFAHTQVFDNNHNPHTLESAADRLEHARSQSYLFCLNLGVVKLLFQFMKKGIHENYLTLEVILNYLHSTWYAGTISEFDAEEIPEKFTWIEILQPSLTVLFNQFKSKLDDNSFKENYIMTVDSMAVKIEGIVRDLVRLNGMSVSKVKENDASEMNLEDMLADEKIRKFFTSEDRLLFRYILTRRGLNIRNNIAHAFYRPSDYSPEKALLLFFCIIRLSKYEIPVAQPINNPI